MIMKTMKRHAMTSKDFITFYKVMELLKEKEAI